MKVLMTTGGTGGHIYPALALADYLVKKHENVDIMFVGNDDRMEKDIIPQKGYRFVGIKAARFNDDGNKLSALKMLYKAYKHCLTLVSDYNPDIVIGFGSYVTVPVIMAAKKLGIKSIIHEQNSIAGMANKTLGHFVNKVVTVYPEAGVAFNSRKVECLGNPRESSVLDLVRDRQILETLDLDSSKKTVLIVMGSLGSASVNEKMIDILNAMNDKPYNVIYVSGKNNYEDIKGKVAESDTLKIFDYIDQFNIAANVDLVVSRAGATSACEYMALGLPAIFVPSPYVPNNHQFINAKSMLDKGASLLLEEKDLSKETLIPLVDELLDDDLRLQKMSQAALSMSHPQAAGDIAALMYKVAGVKDE